MAVETHLGGMSETLGFELPNVGAGPDPLAVADLDDDFAAVLLQRDHYCGFCRRHVRSIADRYPEFAERGATVLAVLPEPPERARSWQERYDLPFPLLADADATVGERYDQPIRFGPVGRAHDLVGRMPAVALLDLRGSAPVLAYAHRGRSPSDRPDADDLLARIDDAS